MPGPALPSAGPPIFAPPSDLITVSMPFVPGYRVVRTIGVTYGLIVRSRGLGRNIVAGFRSLGGGEITEYTELLEQSRHEALTRLKDHAKSLGANAVLSVCFDTSEMSEVMTEILAYGTAVVVEPDPAAAQPVSLR
ncbi:MAG: heavy metal-binding domain-containing protein [Thermoplasmata archaeon]